MEFLSPAPANNGGGGTAPSAQSTTQSPAQAIAQSTAQSIAQSTGQSFGALDADQLRQRCETMSAREKRIVELLGCGTPERIEHDLRNVMNELQLLRTVFEKQEG